MNGTALMRHRILFAVLFLMGANLLIGGSYRARQDSWISLLIAVVLLVLWGIVLARISVLRPGETVFDLLYLFPDSVRFVLTGLLVLYCFGQSAITIRTYAGFARVVSLQNTDLFVPIALLCLSVAFFLRRDDGVLFRFSYVVSLPIIFIIILLFCLLLNMFRTELLYPIYYQNTENVLLCAADNLSFPFGNAFLLLGLLYDPKDAENTRPSWLISCISAGALSLLIVLQNLLLLGGDLAEDLNFPYNFSTSLVNLADFFSRLEVFTSLFFFLSAVVRASFCLKMAVRGINSIVPIESKALGFSMVFLLCGYCLIMFENTNSVFGFLEIFHIIALPLQFVLPALLWLCVEFRARKERRAYGKIGPPL